MTDAVRLIVRSLAQDYPAGYETHRHGHDWTQIVFAEAGVVRVWAERDEYVLPPGMVAMIPIGKEHALRMATLVRIRTLYLRRDLCEPLNDVRILAAAPFLRELIRRVVTVGQLRDDDDEHMSYARILMRELHAADSLPLALRQPADARAVRAAEMAAGGDATLEEIANSCGASARTLQRLFEDETGMGFSRWRQQRRLLDAALALVDGATVADAASAARYDSQSAFVAAFRAQFGETPRRWRDARKQD